MEAISPLPYKFSVLSWNIWFDRFEQELRYKEIFRICKKLLPDVICFQEVTIDFLRFYKQFEDLDKSEYVSSEEQMLGETVEPYGCLTLVKRDLQPTFKIVPFPSNMYRKLVLTSFEINSSLIAVGNVHLESLSNHSCREKQLAICKEELKPYDLKILCGDFNFCSYRNYDGSLPLQNDSLRHILPQMIDVWEDLRGNIPSYTFDGSINCYCHSTERARYDRICYEKNSATYPWFATDIDMLNEPIYHKSIDESNKLDLRMTTPPKVTKTIGRGKDILPMYPSDHFGLLAVFLQDIK